LFEEMTCSFPAEIADTLTNCRILLHSTPPNEDTDTTESTFNLIPLSAGEPSSLLPKRFEITSAYPNPFNSVTQIELAVPQTGPVTIEIYNVAGQRVRTLAHEAFLAGVHRLTWDARSDANLPVGSGLYLCRAVSHGSSVTKKLLLLQ
jgi:hypothetical protein